MSCDTADGCAGYYSSGIGRPPFAFDIRPVGRAPDFVVVLEADVGAVAPVLEEMGLTKAVTVIPHVERVEWTSWSGTELKFPKFTVIISRIIIILLLFCYIINSFVTKVNLKSPCLRHFIIPH